MPIQRPAQAGKLYRPSNATESTRFEEQWCHHCSKEGRCGIWLDAWAFAKDDDEYPREWVFDVDGVPMCTAYVSKTGPASD